MEVIFVDYIFLKYKSQTKNQTLTTKLSSRLKKLYLFC